MSRIRSSMILLGICVVALILGFLRFATQRTPLPTGSSYSTEPNGGQALFDWATALGLHTVRLQEVPAADAPPPTMLLVIQSERLIDADARAALDHTPSAGGTLVVAGDSAPTVLYLRALGVSADPVPPTATALATPDQTLRVSAPTRFRLRAAQATPLLMADDGGVVALRMPYRAGSLVVVATPELLLNDALRDRSAAAFVFRELFSGLPSDGVIAFDEIHHSFAPAGGAAAQPTFDQLLLTTTAGRAALYAGLVLFGYLVLSGRRLGPPIPPRPASEGQRTMFDHVRMLADLYRRAGRLDAARGVFGHHYARHAPEAVLARIRGAGTEAELIEAINRAEASMRRPSGSAPPATDA